MKKHILPAFALMGCLFFSSAASAQEATDSADQQETIILKKKGPFPDDFTLRVQGDQITINGKPPTGMTIIRRKSSANSGRTFQQFRQGPAFGDAIPSPAPFSFSQGNSQALLGVISPRSDSVNGARISEVEAGTPADSAGLKKGDIITKVGDQTIGSSADLRSAIRQQDPGDQVALTYLRDGRTHQIDVILGRLDNRHGMQAFERYFPDNKLSDQWFRRFHPRIDRDPQLRISQGPKLGVIVENHQNPEGTIIRQVNPGTAAATAGFQQGDVITAFGDTAIHNVGELRAAIKTHQGAQDIAVQIQRDGQVQTLQVSLPASGQRAAL